MYWERGVKKVKKSITRYATVSKLHRDKKSVQVVFLNKWCNCLKRGHFYRAAKGEREKERGTKNARNSLCGNGQTWRHPSQLLYLFLFPLYSVTLRVKRKEHTWFMSQRCNILPFFLLSLSPSLSLQFDRSSGQCLSGVTDWSFVC